MAFEINTVPEFYQTYLRFLKDEEVIPFLQASANEFNYLLNTFSNEKAEFRYAEGKWNVKEIIQHILDAERVFTYRAVRFSRNDPTDLPGFDQDHYILHSESHGRDIKELMTEFTSTRYSTISFFSALSEDQMGRKGIASGAEFSVKALGYIISGHLLHHLEVIREKYV